jgi:hypothetical protein
MVISEWRDELCKEMGLESTVRASGWKKGENGAAIISLAPYRDESTATQR